MKHLLINDCNSYYSKMIQSSSDGTLALVIVVRHLTSVTLPLVCNHHLRRFIRLLKLQHRMVPTQDSRQLDLPWPIETTNKVLKSFPECLIIDPIFQCQLLNSFPSEWYSLTLLKRHHGNSFEQLVYLIKLVFTAHTLKRVYLLCNHFEEFMPWYLRTW